MTTKNVKKRKKKPVPEVPFVTMSMGVYTVDGGAVLDATSGASRIDLVGELLGTGSARRGVSLFIPKGELGFYPIGASVRVRVERV